MKLPYCKKAFIPIEKIDNYLLSPTHIKGKHKAVVYGELGFNQGNRSLFEEALLNIAHINDVRGTTNIIVNGVYLGKKYEIIGTITGPNGTSSIKTIWKILLNKRKPSLVTATTM